MTDCSMLQLQYLSRTETFALVDGKLHLPTVEHFFGIRDVKLDGAVYPRDTQGYAMATFPTGRPVVVTGTPGAW